MTKVAPSPLSNLLGGQNKLNVMDRIAPGAHDHKAIQETKQFDSMNRGLEAGLLTKLFKRETLYESRVSRGDV